MKTYVCSDLHGMYELYEKIANFINDGDIIYCLGDAGDRGPQAWETLRDILRNPQFKYIRGNHDDMLIRAYHEYNLDDSWENSGAQQLLFHNGGYETLLGLLQERFSGDWVRFLIDKPFYETYTNTAGDFLIMCHAGFTPRWFESGKIQRAIEFNNGSIRLPPNERLLWSREHFGGRWDTNLPNVKMIHGHTPIPLLKRELPFWTDEEPLSEGTELKDIEEFSGGVLFYCDNHKICIDNGSFISNTATLLDLDTYEQHIFKI